jgi:ABC-type polysaccharide/polyol phosphate transport system ATPase subunit
VVSHALQTVKELCSEAIWMHKGQLQMSGEPDEVIKAYTHFLKVGETAVALEDV